MGMLIERIVRDDKIAEELGLSEDQVETISNALYEHKVKEIDLKAGMQKAGLEQARLLTAKEVDEDAIMVAVEKTGRIRTNLAKLKIERLLLLKNTLTEEQIETAKNMMRKRMRKQKDRRRGGKERRGGQEGRECRGRCGPGGGRPDDGPPPGEGPGGFVEPNEAE